MSMMKPDVKSILNEHLSVCKKIEPSSIERLAASMGEALKKGNKLLICGNGGSAADAQHLAAELTGRFKKERKGLAGLALTTDTSALTAIANDYGYEQVFSRQVEALGKKGDVLLLISTSGNSSNLLLAAKKAREMGIAILGLLGKGGGKARELCDFSIIVPSDNTPRIQEMHGLILHVICELMDEEPG